MRPARQTGRVPQETLYVFALREVLTERCDGFRRLSTTLEIVTLINRNAQYLHWCTKIYKMYLLKKIIILTNFNVISTVVESRRIAQWVPPFSQKIKKKSKPNLQFLIRLNTYNSF